MPQYFQSPCQGSFGDCQPPVLSQEFFEGLFFEKSFVDLLDRVHIEIIRDIDSVELQDVDPFGKFREFEIRGGIEDIGNHPSALERFATQSPAYQPDAFIEPLVDFSDGSRVLLSQRLELLLGQPIRLFELFADALGYGHDRTKMEQLLLG